MWTSHKGLFSMSINGIVKRSTYSVIGVWHHFPFRIFQGLEFSWKFVSLPQCRVNRQWKWGRQTEWESLGVSVHSVWDYDPPAWRALSTDGSSLWLAICPENGRRSGLVVAGPIWLWGHPALPLSLALSMPSMPPSTLWSFSSPALAQGSPPLRYLFSWIFVLDKAELLF